MAHFHTEVILQAQRANMHVALVQKRSAMIVSTHLDWVMNKKGKGKGKLKTWRVQPSPLEHPPPACTPKFHTYHTLPQTADSSPKAQLGHEMILLKTINIVTYLVVLH